MKKSILALGLAVLFAIPAFAATVTVERKKPSELNLSFAKSICITPVKVYRKGYESDQKELGAKFVSELKKYHEKDGKFALKIETAVDADIDIKIEFTDFNVSDFGGTLTQKIDGEERVIKDEWTRAVGGQLECTVIRCSDNTVIGSKSFKLFGGDSDYVPKASLRDPVTALTKQMEDNAYLFAGYIYDSIYYEPFSIMDTKSKDKDLKNKMKAILKDVKAKKYEEAKSAYKDIYEATEDFAAGFNYARMLQATFDFDDAEILLKKLSVIDPKNKTIKQAFESLAKDKVNKEILTSRGQ